MTRDAAWLEDVFAAVDLVFFGERMHDDGVTIRWKRFRAAKAITKYACYWAAEGDDKPALIEVHQAFRNEWVPVHVVVSLVFHECLHHIHGKEHSSAFRRDEQRDPHFAMSDAWTIEHYDQLIAARPPRKEGA